MKRKHLEKSASGAAAQKKTFQNCGIKEMQKVEN